MKIGMIDVDSHNYPNLAQMKISAWHKSQGDDVELHRPGTHYDKVYMSKVFSFTDDYKYPIDADEVIRGGSGYHISVKDGREVWCGKDNPLPYEIEHIYPDYSLYGITDTAYGHLTMGCPRQCSFCHVKSKEGIQSYKTADLREFWDGQKYIEELSPNLFACKDWEDLLGQLIESKAYVNFNQGVDVRVMTPRKVELLKQCKLKAIHFAWDRPKDGSVIVPKLEMVKEITGWHRSKCIVYILTNFDSTFQEDLHRVMECRRIGVDPYVMVYNKSELPRICIQKKLQRWVNNRPLWAVYDTFEEYCKGQYKSEVVIPQD